MGNFFSFDLNLSAVQLSEDADPIKKVALGIYNSHNRVVALTGSGISVDSGIPTFRHQDALWKKFNPEEFGTIQSFKKDPTKIWNLCKTLPIESATPNQAHYVVSQLEKMNIISTVITQNVDGLHQIAGSKNVIEMHGNSREAICPGCSKIVPMTIELLNKEIPPKCLDCGDVLKPVKWKRENLIYLT